MPVGFVVVVVLERKLEVKDGALNAEPGVIVCCGWRECAGGLVA